MFKMKQHKRHRVLITGGGTGGHVFPAIAIAKSLKNLFDIDILFIGAKNKMEMQKVPVEGFRIFGLPIVGFNRRRLLKNIIIPYHALRSIIKAYIIIKRWKPNVVVGVGGYASWPALFVANILGIPMLLHEQNSFPGLVNRQFSRKARKICVAYEGMDKFFPKDKIYLTGNPIRSELLNIEIKKQESCNYFGLDPHLPVILVLGGSLGAQSINRAMISLLSFFITNKVQLIWQTGKYYYIDILNQCSNYHSLGVKIIDFIERMDLAYAAADLIISRAGALAISELCVVGKPVILIPSPNVADNHQMKNAQILKNTMAAECILDHELAEKLPDIIISILRDKQKQEKMHIELKRLAINDADRRIANQIMEIIYKNNNDK